MCVLSNPSFSLYLQQQEVKWQRKAIHKYILGIMCKIKTHLSGVTSLLESFINLCLGSWIVLPASSGMIPVKTFYLLICFELYLTKMYIIMEIIYFSINLTSRITVVFRFNQTLHSSKVRLLLCYTSDKYKVF